MEKKLSLQMVKPESAGFSTARLAQSSSTGSWCRI
jgi:hypothetical protein